MRLAVPTRAWMSHPAGIIDAMNTAQAATAQIATIHPGEDGTPLSVEMDGRRWAVVAEPLRWFERIDRWWTTPGLRLPRGTGARVIDQEVMRLEVRLGSVQSQITSLELVRRGDSWQVRDVLRAA